MVEIKQITKGKNILYTKDIAKILNISQSSVCYLFKRKDNPLPDMGIFPGKKSIRTVDFLNWLDK